MKPSIHPSKCIAVPKFGNSHLRDQSPHVRLAATPVILGAHIALLLRRAPPVMRVNGSLHSMYDAICRYTAQAALLEMGSVTLCPKLE